MKATTIHVTGKHFPNNTKLQCIFMDAAGMEKSSSVPAVYHHDEHVSCDAPSMQRPVGAMIVEISMNKQYTTMDKKEISFHLAPRVTSISPRQGSTGEMIDVHGHHFLPHAELTCWFGNLPSTKTTYVNDHHLRCVAPVATTLESGDAVAQDIVQQVITVSNNGLPPLSTTSSSSAVVAAGTLFSHRPVMHVAALTPNFGTSNGGTTLTLVGTGFYFHGNSHCLFDMIKVKATYISSTEMRCVAPPSGIGRVTVRLSMNGVSLLSNKNMIDYNYIVFPSITSLLPSWSFIQGMVPVNVSGSGFVNTSTLSCVFMEQTQHEKDGSDAMELLKKGNTRVPALFINPTLVQCVPPPVSFARNVVLEIDVNGQDQTKEGKIYQYRKEPMILMLSPKSGPLKGGTTLEIVGNQFSKWYNDVDCIFGDEGIHQRRTRAVWVSATRSTCTTPSGAHLQPNNHSNSSSIVVPFNLGTMNVRFPNSLDTQKTTFYYEYLSPLRLNSFEPTFGTVSGGTIVTLHGYGFRAYETLQCRFGKMLTSFATYVNESIVTCVAPPFNTNDAVAFVDISVSNDGSSFYTTSIQETDNGGKLQYKYTLKSTVTSVWPSSASVNTRDKVIVFGQNFPPDSALLRCQFGSAYRHTVGLRLNGSAIQCNLPIENIELQVLTHPTTTQLSISSNGKDVTNQDITFTFLRGMMVSGMEPIRGHVGTTLVISGMHFVDSQGLQCLFGIKSPVYNDPEQQFHHNNMTSAGQWISTTTVRCVIPRSLSSGTSTSPDNTAAVDIWITNNAVDWHLVPSTFMMVPSPTIETMIPASGTIAGGTTITLTGHGFVDVQTRHGTMECVFGREVSTEALIFNSNQEIMCVSPVQLNATQKVQVGVVLNGQILATSPTVYQYYSPPRSISISPTTATLSTSIVIHVTGSGFLIENSHTALCKFGSYTATPATVVSNILLQCTSPQRTTAVAHSGRNSDGWASLSISLNGVDWSHDGVELFLSPSGYVSSIAPTNGRPGTTIRLFGDHFVEVDTLSCSFGNATVKGKWESSKIMSCIVPNSISSSNAADSIVLVKMSNNGVDFSTISVPFTLTRTMSVTRVVPSLAYDTHGVEILLINDQGGFQALSGSIRCRFGPLHTAAGIQINSTTILCTAPPHPSGSVQIYLSTNGIDYVDTMQTLTYLTSPVLTNMKPSYGSSKGGSEGQMVVLSVSNLPATTTMDPVCWFGDILSTAIVLNQTNIGCQIPPHALGSVALSLEWPELSGTSSHHRFYMHDHNALFTYFALPHVSRSRPSEGTAAGGTSILVHGSNFQVSTHLSCRFKTILMGEHVAVEVPARWINASAVECVSPVVTQASQMHARVELSVTNDGDYYSSPALTYTYLPRLRLLSVYPESGSINGGTSVVIRGTSFDPRSHTACRFGNHSSVRSVVINSTAISCTTPRNDDHGVIGATEAKLTRVVRVTVARNGEEYQNEKDNAVYFTYAPPPMLISISPREGLVGTSTQVELYGKYYSKDHTFCRVLGTLMKTTWIQSTKIICHINLTTVSKTHGSTSSMSRTNIPIEVSTNGQQWYAGFDTYRSYNASQVDTVEPLIGSESGGTQVLISGWGFLNRATLRCRFGTVVVVAEWISSTMAQCVSPPAVVPGEVNIAVSNNGQDFVGKTLGTFVYHPIVTITEVVPTQGTYHGGTMLQLQGINLFASGTMMCNFGDVYVVPAVHHAATNTTTCVTPSVPKPMLLPLSLSINGVDSIYSGVDFVFESSDEDKFVYESLSMAPTSGSIYGGDSITFSLPSSVQLWGHEDGNSNREFSCIFERVDASASLGTNMSSVSLLSSATTTVVKAQRVLDNVAAATCIVPASTVGPTSSRVTLMDEETGLLLGGSTYTYHSPMLLFSFSPTFGSVHGNTKMMLRGANFVNSSTHLYCVYTHEHTSIKVVAAYKSPTLLECIVPNSDIVKNVTVAVTYNSQTMRTIHSNQEGNSLLTTTDRFTYTPIPTILHVAPRRGPVEGGTLITLVGLHFDTTSFNSEGESSGGLSFCNFEYKDEQHVQMRTIRTKSNVINTTHMQCMTPDFRNSIDSNSAPSLLAMVVYPSFNDLDTTVEDYERNDENITFIPYTTPLLQEIVPTEGSSGTVVNIQATLTMSLSKESNTVMCRFGNSIASYQFVKGQVTADTKNNLIITCIVPPRGDEATATSSKSVQVEVSFNNGSDYTNSGRLLFLHRARPRVLYFTPETGTEIGGTEIQMHGLHFYNGDGADALGCQFGGATPTLVPATFINTTFIICNAPINVPGTLQLMVTTNGKDMHAAERVKNSMFTYTMHTYIAKVEPLVAMSDGGTTLTIYGGNFVFNPLLSCRFGRSVVVAMYHNSNTIQCVVPSTDNYNRASNMDVEVEVANNGVDYVSFHSDENNNQSMLIQYTSRPIVQRVTPTRVASRPLLSSTSSSLSTTLFVEGKHFIVGSTWCVLGNQVSPAVVKSTKALSCVLSTKEYKDKTEIVVRVTTTYQHKETNNSVFTLPSSFVDYSRELNVTVVVVHPPEIISLYPNRASLAQNEFKTTLQGISFVQGHPQTECRITGHVENVVVVGELEFISSSIVRCTIPLTHRILPGMSSLSIHSGGVSSNAVNVTFVAPPSIASIAPSFASILGGAIVSLTGTNIIESKSFLCHFGDQHIIAGKYTNGTHAHCQVPSVLQAHSTNLSLSFDGGAFFTLNAMPFEYISASKVVFVEPTAGSVHGGTLLQIKGNGFIARDDADYKCKFTRETTLSTVPAVSPAVRINETTIHCISPVSLTAGVNFVEISMNGGEDYTMDRAEFKYRIPVRATAISGSHGPESGGTVVFVHGRHFYSSFALGCRFGKALTAGTFINDTCIECIAPTLQAARTSATATTSVPVSVTLNGYDYIDVIKEGKQERTNTSDASSLSFSSSVMYSYNLLEYILHVSPSRIMVSGGTLVTIHGGHFVFSPQLSCRFGDYSNSITPATYYNSTTIQCTSPPAVTTSAGTSAVINVGVANNGFDFVEATAMQVASESLTTAVEYVETPIIQSVYPSRISRGGGGNTVAIAVKGQHFLPKSMKVRLAATNAIGHCKSIVNSSQMKCYIKTSPARTEQSDDRTMIQDSIVQISNNNGHDWFDSGGHVKIYFKNEPYIHSMNPSMSSMRGGTLITIKGNHLGSSSNTLCSFARDTIGDSSTPLFVHALVVTDTYVQCYTPINIDTEGNYKVSLHLSNSTMITNSLMHTFMGLSIVLSIKPTNGPIEGGTEVTVLGYNFIYATDLLCQFGSIYLPGLLVSSSYVICV